MNGKKSKIKPLALIAAVAAVVTAIAATAESFAFISSIVPEQTETQTVTEIKTEATTVLDKSTQAEKTERRTERKTHAETTTETQIQQPTRRDIKLPVWTRPQKKQDASYFDDAIFVGDSRLEDFVMYMELPQENCYADVGLSVTTAFTKEFVQVGSKKLTAMDAVKQNKTFKKAYLMFGLNEIGWPYPKEFVKAYGKVIDAVLQSNPDAIVYVQSILPVTEALDAKGGDENNERIREINSYIKQLAEDKGVIYLDVASAVQDEKGCLPAYAAKDGVHMGKSICTRWYDYLLNNTAKKSIFS